MKLHDTIDVIIGGYLSRIYTETKQRPRFIVEKSL